MTGSAPHESSLLDDLRKDSTELTGAKRNVSEVGIIGTKRPKCSKRFLVATSLFHALLHYNLNPKLITKSMHRFLLSIDEELHNEQEIGLKIISVTSDSILFDVKHKKTKQIWRCIVHKCSDEIRKLKFNI
jgi:hypothetical protein